MRIQQTDRVLRDARFARRHAEGERNAPRRSWQNSKVPIAIATGVALVVATAGVFLFWRYRRDR